MMDLQGFERCLALLLQEHYMEDGAIRHHPLYQGLDRLHQQVW